MKLPSQKLKDIFHFYVGELFGSVFRKEELLPPYWKITSLEEINIFIVSKTQNSFSVISLFFISRRRASFPARFETIKVIYT